MSKVNTTNKFGYKVCYKEGRNEDFVLSFKSHTFNTATRARKIYLHFIPNKSWNIIPISKTEYKSGIWKEKPF